MTAFAFEVAMAALGVDVEVNPTKDAVHPWEAIDWRRHEDNVRRLRQRIFKAAQVGDLATVRNLQKLMLRSWSNTLVGVRQATQRNAGRRTAGIDGEVALTPSARMEMANRVHSEVATWQPQPVRRVYIPKAGNRAKLRPLGIPVIADRCHQGRVRNALEPEWEARFEPRSYGFRPGRSCQDAIEAIFNTSKGSQAKRVWVLDADLAAAFDRIDHDRLVEALGSFPARDLIQGWLKAGVFEHGKGFAPTEEGTPQGGVISPLLLNVALHGLETAAGVSYKAISRLTTGAAVRADSPVVVRYADDLVALCHSQDQAQQVKTRLAEWLAPRGLAFNEDKTTVVHLDDGFDFLGFNIRRHRGKLIIKPSKTALKRIRSRLAAEMRALRGANAAAVIAKIAPVIRGWAAYYRAAVSSKAFSGLDIQMWRLTYKWATFSHRNKPKSWVTKRYFGPFNPTRNDRWVFGDRNSGRHLPKFSWTPIVRHQMVPGTASPDDPSLALYWRLRRERSKPPIGNTTLRLLKNQDGRCPLCGEHLLYADREPQTPQEWEQWITGTQTAIAYNNLIANGTPAKPADTQLVHKSCQRRTMATARSTRSQLHNATPSGLA